MDDLFDDSEDYGADGDFEIRGHVTNLNATSNTFKLLGITVDYSSAEFVANIQNGSFVKSEGSYNGTILQAHEVENEIDDNRDENFEARGTVTNLDTTAKTFAFHGFTVNYSGARLDAQPVNGSQINVEGLLNGSVITATKLEDGDPSGNGGGGGGTHNNGADGDIELRGRITNFNTTTKTFDLLGLRVSFSNAQLIGQLGNGAFVKVDGRYNGTQIVAREVETEIDDNRDENFEARGVISNLDTNAKQFEFLGFSVNYSRAALETQLANGASVEIQGIYANFFVDADEIR